MTDMNIRGIRVNDVCRVFDEFKDSEIILPDILKEQMHFMCDMAGLGDPNFLEPYDEWRADCNRRHPPTYYGGCFTGAMFCVCRGRARG